MTETTALVAPAQGATYYRMSTDAAGLCGAIVKQTAIKIQGRKYVTIDGWSALAAAHGCVLSARDVERVDDGYRAIGEVRRASDGALLATGEGFLGDDEAMWQKRPIFARKAMAQTRAMSRAGRSAFSFVVTIIDAGLSTTPAEEMQGAIEHEPASMLTHQSRALDEAAREITAQTGESRSTYEIEKPKKAAAKAKDWTDKAIVSVNLGDHTAESLKAFWVDSRKQLEWLFENAQEQHDRFMVAYDAAMERAAAKAA